MGDTAAPHSSSRGQGGGEAGPGREGQNFNKCGCFVHTRAGSQVFWLNSVTLEMQQQGGKGELF